MSSFFAQNKAKDPNNQVSPTSMEFGEDGGTKTATVQTIYYNNWSATTPQGWITLTGTPGKGNGAFDVTAASTTVERTGTVTVSFDMGENINIGVSQIKYEVMSFAALDGNMNERSGFTYTGTERYWEGETMTLSFSYDSDPFWIGVDKWQYRQAGGDWIDVPNSASETATLTGPDFDVDIRVLLIGS